MLIAMFAGELVIIGILGLAYWKHFYPLKVKEKTLYTGPIRKCNGCQEKVTSYFPITENAILCVVCESKLNG